MLGMSHDCLVARPALGPRQILGFQARGGVDCIASWQEPHCMQLSMINMLSLSSHACRST